MKKPMPQMARNGNNKYGAPRPKVVCILCKQLLAQNQFSYIDKADPSKGIRLSCKPCAAKHAQHVRELRAIDWKYKPAKAMLNNSKRRAKVNNLEHTITVDDIVIPDRCPILNILLQTGSREQHSNAPSIDRIDNTKGYTKDNIVIISNRANMLKRNATINELVLLGEYYKKYV